MLFGSKAWFKNMRRGGKMREMVGGCCVCSDERGWAENPLVYCDGAGCNVAVHQGLCSIGGDLVL